MKRKPILDRSTPVIFLRPIGAKWELYSLVLSKIYVPIFRNFKQPMLRAWGSRPE